MKKLLPVIFLVVLAVAALAIKHCNTEPVVKQTNTKSPTASPATKTGVDRDTKFSRNVTKFFFTKHARCRMKCRQITQREVKEILAEGTINYNKSDLNDPQGPTYALEGKTDDRQNVRVIFAPKQQHMSVVTVIDLDVAHQCDCN